MHNYASRKEKGQALCDPYVGTEDGTGLGAAKVSRASFAKGRPRETRRASTGKWGTKAGIWAFPVVQIVRDDVLYKTTLRFSQEQ